MPTDPTAAQYTIYVCPDCAQTHQMTPFVPDCGSQMVKQGRNLWRCSCGFKGAYVALTVVPMATRDTDTIADALRIAIKDTHTRESRTKAYAAVIKLQLDRERFLSALRSVNAARAEG